MTTRTVIILSAAATVTVVGGILWMQARRSRRRKGTKRICDDKTAGFLTRPGCKDLLPEHVKREIHKKKRRREKIPLLAAKSPPYDNIFMVDPEGRTLSTISTKKANWYVEKKKIATWRSPNTIQLLFEPSGRSSDEYNVAKKYNVCVACGLDEHVMRHYVVPYAYRSLLPKKYKSHLSHDIVILCPKCHLHCSQAYQEQMKLIESRLRTNPETAAGKKVDKQLSRVRSAGLALLNWREKLPDDRIEEYSRLVRAHLGLSEIEELSNEYLQEAINVKYRIINPDYISGAELVVTDVLSQSGSRDVNLAEFVKGWRQFFLQTVQPRFLPHGWRVDAPVTCSDHKM